MMRGVPLRGVILGGLLVSLTGVCASSSLPQDFRNHALKAAHNFQRTFEGASARMAKKVKLPTSRADPFFRRSSSSSSSFSELKTQNENNVLNMMKVIDSDGWTPVVTTKGSHPIQVWRKTLPPGTHGASDAANDVAAEKFACIKATAVVQASPQDVYNLFLDNARVNEYNEHCHKLEDVEQLSSDTKIAWSATKPFGIFKARDFLTMVHYCERKDGTLMAVNRPATHHSRPATGKGSGQYQRAELLLAGNVMKPVRGDPDKTEFTLITHINPGGIVDNAIGAAITNKLSATSPVDFIRKLEIAAQTASTAPLDAAKKLPANRAPTTRKERTDIQITSDDSILEAFAESINKKKDAKKDAKKGKGKRAPNSKNGAASSGRRKKRQPTPH